MIKCWYWVTWTQGRISGRTRYFGDANGVKEQARKDYNHLGFSINGAYMA
jgi:hypothetical protein